MVGAPDFDEVGSAPEAVPTSSAYRWWLASDSSAAAATGLRDFVLPLLALMVTGSAAQAGLVGTVQAALTQAFLIPGGLIIDRFDRKRLIVISGVVNGSVLFMLAILGWSGHLSFGALLGAAVVFGLASGWLGEASDAVLRSVVTVERYPQAITVNEGRDAALRLAATPIGGYLLGIAAGAGLALAGGLQALSALLIRPLRIAPICSEKTAGAKSLVLEAIKWLQGRRRAILLTLLVGAVNFSVSGVMTTTQFNAVARTGRALDAGLLTTAAGVSVIVGAIVASGLVRRLRTGLLIPLTFGWLAIGMAGLAVFNSGVPLVALLVLTFLGVPSINAGMAGYFFASTPAAMQGRAQALLATLSVGIGAFAPLLVGVTLQSCGPTAAYVAALSPMVVALFVSVFAKRIREIPRPAQWADLPL